MKRTFTTALLKGWGLPYDLPSDGENGGGEIISDSIIETSRWSEIHDLLFRAPDDGLVYAVSYSQGLTEYQDEDPWEDETEVIGTQMLRRQVTQMVWEQA